jgi:hypothetical protein
VRSRPGRRRTGARLIERLLAQSQGLIVVHAISLPVALNERRDILDPNGEIFVLADEEREVRARNDGPSPRLVPRAAGAGDREPRLRRGCRVAGGLSRRRGAASWLRGFRGAAGGGR